MESQGEDFNFLILRQIFSFWNWLV